MTTETSETTYTFFGHWRNDRIVVTEYVEGVVQDEREDTGRYEQGLWAAAAAGPTVDEAEAAAKAEYEDS